MRILYLDIDTLRPDHLGCYGYHRNTSPNLDAVATSAVRYTNCYTPDAPCLPSRAALFSGQFGLHTGVVNHGGEAADPRLEGASRGFRSRYSQICWTQRLRQTGLYPVSFSSFAERHSAFWYDAGFRELYNPGQGGLERADEVVPTALDWLQRHRGRDNWFMHLHVWDPHTPYRTPDEYGSPFAEQPLAGWYTEELRQQHFAGYGPHSAHAPQDISLSDSRWPRMPAAIASMDDYRQWVDGYDVGIRYADDHLGRVLNELADQNVLDETVIIVSSDHGENLGELNIYGDHQTADHVTSRIPLLIRWPGVTPRVDTGLLYNFDMAATVVELAGGSVPEEWDGRSFAGTFRRGEAQGRDDLVVSQCAWSCQRSVRWDRWMLLRTFHAGWKALPPAALYDVENDPHELVDLAAARPDVLAEGIVRLDRWRQEQMACSRSGTDPLWLTIREGGPLHTRGRRANARYLARLRAEGKAHFAEHLEQVYGDQGPTD